MLIRTYLVESAHARNWVSFVRGVGLVDMVGGIVAVDCGEPAQLLAQHLLAAQLMPMS